MNLISHEFDKPAVGFLFFPEHISSTIVESARRTGVKAVFDLTGIDPGRSAEELFKLGTASGAAELKLSPDALLDPTVLELLKKTKITTVWVELHDALMPGTGALLEKISELSDELTIVPVTGGVPLIRNIIENHPGIKTIAIKGSESSGFVGSETLFILYSAVRQMIRERTAAPALAVWGGVALAEAAAAFLSTGAKRIVFESVHWLTDLFTAPEDFRTKVANLRPDHTDLAGENLGTPCRLFNKGNSRAVKELKDFAASLCGPETTHAKQRIFRERIRSRLVPPHLGSFGSNELIAIGIEASFASSFVNRYGSRTETAIAGFIKQIEKHLADSPKAANAFKRSDVAREMGVSYPFIQGAMTWITDNPGFARRVAEAGALPTIALGTMDEASLEERLGNLPSVMGDFPYALNVITLKENPFREAQLAWIKRIKPRFAVIAAGEPSHATDLISAGIEVIYIAPNEELLLLALEKGVRFVICEGSEAGGHVGLYTTLTWAQLILDLKLRSPALSGDGRIVLAGGIFDRETAFMAAMLGADAVQMGTAYLAVSDIIETGSLSPLYQKMVLESQSPSTVVTGEVTGLRVRSLKTPRVDAIGLLERDSASRKEDEASFRSGMEVLSAGSLYVAARGMSRTDGSVLSDAVCIEQGQFMSGAVAGAINRVKSARELHLELAQGILAEGLPFTGPLTNGALHKREHPVRTAVSIGAGWAGKRERIAITGMSLVNSLGNSPQAVWAAGLNMESGIRHVPSDRWNHALFYHPRPGIPEKTYCKFGAFQNIAVERKDIDVPPQDFRTMTDSTKLTLWLASNAIQESGLLESDIPRERIAVLISQNSGEAAATLQDVIIRASIGNIMGAVNRAAHLSARQQAAVEEEIKAGRIAIDDTTLLGRLNCSAGGFICNRFGFMGPSFSVSAACATGLVALYSAYQMVRNGVIDAAVVGGAEEFLTPMHFLEFSALGALAGISGAERPPREVSRPFDLDRDGMVLGEGGAMIVIERETLARKRGAGIYAYITSMGASNNHLGMVESSRITQRIAIGASLEDLPYGPGSIDLVECHATATRQGDIEEVRALKSFFNSGTKTVLTSFKSQIGHTLGASGLNSLIRGVTAMNAGIFPPTLNCRNPDPQMELEGSGLIVLPEPETWRLKAAGPRRMQVNAFGFGGSNYVVQLEQAIDKEDSILVSPTQNAAHFEPKPMDFPEGLSLFKTEIGGRPYRLAVRAQSDEAALELLEPVKPLVSAGALSSKRLKALGRQGIHLSKEQTAPRLAFVFPGQGSHYAGMGYELYQTFPLIREWMERAASVAEFDLLRLLFFDREKDLRKTRWQQPALFTLEYAMARYFWSLGIRPAALAGHSLGELTALCLAGVYSFEDGFRIVDRRAECMDKACRMNKDPGVMMAVDAPIDLIRDILAKRRGVYLTNINSPGQLVIGGDSEEVEFAGAELKRSGYRSSLLPVGMAFHSPVMSCIHDELEAFIAGIEFNAPRIPVVSNTTREPFPDDPGEIKRILMAHLESPVHWMANVQTLWNDFDIRLFVEVGPREILSNLIIETMEKAECIATCLPSAEVFVFKTALAELYARGNLPVRRPVRFISFPQDIESGKPADAAQVALKPDRAANLYADPLEAIVYKQIGSFMLESFGRFLKPGILSAVRSEYDPEFSEQSLESALSRMFPGFGNAGKPPDASPFSNPGREARARAGTDRIEDVTEAVIHIIMSVTGYERGEVDPVMDLREDLSIRSSRLPVIMEAVEGRFGIKVEFEDFRDARTIRDIAERISEVMERDDSKKARRGFQVDPGSEALSQVDKEARKLPVKRLVFKEKAIESADVEPVELTASDSIVLLTSTIGAGSGRQVGDILRRDYGCSIRPMSFLEGSADAGQSSFDLRTVQGSRLAAEALLDIESLAGVAVLLDDALESGLHSVEEVSRLLEGFFSLLKAFLGSSHKKFVILVGLSDRPRGFVRLLTEGLSGLFLSAAHEFSGVLFRSVRLKGKTDIRDVIRGALDRSRQYTETIFEGERTLTLAGELSPIVFDEKPRLKLGDGDVVLFSGGCSGIMPYLAKSLVPYGCKVAFMGRTPLERNRSDSASSNEDASGRTAQGLERSRQIASVLSTLKETGIYAEYFQGDVTDPVSVSSVVRSIEEKLGKITGIVHGAGILRDGFMNDMSAEDFSSVVGVKLIGAWNLFEHAQESLKFFTCLSSAACIQGNPGQVNYACANRAMSALMSGFRERNDRILFKSFILPPIEGAGMAEDPGIRAAMKLINAAYIHVLELSHLFLRELFLGPPEDVWVLFMRSLPDLRNVCLKVNGTGPDKAIESNGMLYYEKSFPLIDRVTNLNLQSTGLIAEKDFNPASDPWILDHKPFKFMKHPLVSAIMVLELFMEACKILHPTLEVRGVGEAKFLDMIECPPGATRYTLVQCKTISWRTGEVVCEVCLLAKGISPSGGSVDKMSPGYKAFVLLGATPRDDMKSEGFPVGMEELDTRSIGFAETIKWYEDRSELKNRYRVLDSLEGTAPGAVRGRMIYRACSDFKGAGSTNYRYSPYVLEALLQVASFYVCMRDEAEKRAMIPLGISEVLLGRRCGDGEEVILEARVREQDHKGITWDARATGRDGEVLMILKKLRMGWFSG